MNIEGHIKVTVIGSISCGTYVVCLVWGKIEPATGPSRTILYDALNGQTASSHRSRFMPHLPNACKRSTEGYKYACARLIDGLG